MILNVPQHVWQLFQSLQEGTPEVTSDEAYDFHTDSSHPLCCVEC